MSGWRQGLEAWDGEADLGGGRQALARKLDREIRCTARSCYTLAAHTGARLSTLLSPAYSGHKTILQYSSHDHCTEDQGAHTNNAVCSALTHCTFKEVEDEMVRGVH